MKGFVIFIQAMILWIISMVFAILGGFIAGAVTILWSQSEDKKKVKVTEGKIQKEKNASFTILFDDRSRSWSETYEINQMFLRNVQSYMNDRLRNNGYVFVNDLCLELGLPRTSAGQRYGWLASNESSIELNPELIANGVVMLKFEVDGEIWDLI